MILEKSLQNGRQSLDGDENFFPGILHLGPSDEAVVDFFSEHFFPTFGENFVRGRKSPLRCVVRRVRHL